MLNVAVLMGRLVADPELKHTPSDIAVTRFTIAVNRNYGKTAEETKKDPFHLGKTDAVGTDNGSADGGENK